jgi:phenylacetate-CoA ligase
MNTTAPPITASSGQRRKAVVAVVCHFPPPPGGMPGQAEALAIGLEAAGWTVLRVSTNLRGGPVARWLDAKRGVRTVVRAPVYLLRLAGALTRADIVHVLAGSWLSFFLFASPAVLGGWLFGRSVVLHYHGGEAEVFFTRWRRAVRWVIARADTILVPSTFLEPPFAKLGFPVTVLPNICEPGRFTFDPVWPREPVFLVARHLEPLYDVGCVIEAFAQIRKSLPAARLLVAGHGSEWTSLHALARMLKVNEAVEFLGYVDNQRMPDVYARASVLLNASRADNTPVAILEAFAAGVPVVSSSAGGIPHLLEHGRLGVLVPVGDHQALADGALSLFADVQATDRLRTRARAAVERCAWSAVAEALMRLEPYRSESTAIGGGVAASEPDR